ncbi:hypothetical protein J6Z48_03110 [bacterium]|nr:hypothetical protein [bacterium]
MFKKLLSILLVLPIIAVLFSSPVLGDSDDTFYTSTSEEIITITDKNTIIVISAVAALAILVGVIIIAAIDKKNRDRRELEELDESDSDED